MPVALVLVEFEPPFGEAPASVLVCFGAVVVVVAGPEEVEPVLVTGGALAAVVEGELT